MIDAAVKRAPPNKAVVIIFESKFCEWCSRFNSLVAQDPALRAVIRQSFDIFRVEIGRFDANLHVAAYYGAPIKEEGVPFLVRLDRSGAVAARQSTTVLEGNSENYLNARVLRLLRDWAAGITTITSELARIPAVSEKGGSR